MRVALRITFADVIANAANDLNAAARLRIRFGRTMEWRDLEQSATAATVCKRVGEI